MQELLILCFVGAILMLDNAAAFQILVSQPLFASPILGWIGGDATLGFQLGFLLQLIWLSNMPIGAAVVPEGNFGSIAAVILALRLVKNFPQLEYFIIFVVILYGLLGSYVGAKTVTFIRHWNQQYLQRLLLKLKQNNPVQLGWVIFVSLVFNVVVVFVVFIVMTVIMEKGLGLLFPYMPEEINRIGHHAQIAIIGAGLGLTLTLFKGKRYRTLYLIGVLLGGAIIFYDTIG